MESCRQDTWQLTGVDGIHSLINAKLSASGTHLNYEGALKDYTLLPVEALYAYHDRTPIAPKYRPYLCLHKHNSQLHNGSIIGFSAPFFPETHSTTKNHVLSAFSLTVRNKI
jgi:hypothetical protein